ncbi:MAG: hypothetical protein L7F77_14780 [Candidatus Magnetominusculus sp. LBB02]|nr:hypothetical protein [Candidatus Magnetominusculus sp. LBB02]
MTLTVEQYNDSERASLCRLSNRAIEAFAPVHFNAVNYPARVYSHNDLVRYVDTMHDWEMSDYFKMPYSEDEGKMCAEVCGDVAALTKQEFDRATRPINAPLGAIFLWRIIQNIKKTFGCDSVFEFGPGSGYLGTYLIKSGYSYASMDNTQAFYLWQSLLFDFVSGGRLAEFAITGAYPPPDAPELSHIPWWIYSSFHKDEYLGRRRYDVVVCNRILGELSRSALRYILKTSRQMLEGSGTGLVIFEGPGALTVNTFDEIMAAFEEFGFIPILGDGFFCFTIKSSKPARYACDYSLIKFGRQQITLGIPGVYRLSGVVRKAYNSVVKDNPLYNAGKAGGTLMAANFMEGGGGENPLDYDFLKYIDKDGL